MCFLLRILEYCVRQPNKRLKLTFSRLTQPLHFLLVFFSPAHHFLPFIVIYLVVKLIDFRPDKNKIVPNLKQIRAKFSVNTVFKQNMRLITTKLTGEMFVSNYFNLILLFMQRK